MTMASTEDFAGFPRQCSEFYAELARNNSKSWFDEHKNDYEQYVMVPARSFVFEMGKRLAEISPKINADPRINKSIFRPYRDTRFSKDKTPYKTHLGIFFWEGKLPKMECSGFYFHVEPPVLFLGAGIHCFSPKLLDAYRQSVVDPKEGPALVKAVTKIRSKPGYSVGGRHYKKLPMGFQAEGLSAELLLHNGLFAGHEVNIPDDVYSHGIIDYCFGIFKEMVLVHRWLVRMTDRIG